MQKVSYCNTENAPCDQYKVGLMKILQREVADKEVEGGLRGSPLINSYIRPDITH
jgi:hypothetical protein